MIEKKCAGDRVSGKNTEIDGVVPDQCGPKGEHPADPVLKAFYFICGKCVDQLHSLFLPCSSRIFRILFYSIFADSSAFGDL